MVGVAPTARPVTIIPLVADTSRSESPLLSHLTRAKRTAYPLNESSPDPRHMPRRGKTPKTFLEGKTETEDIDASPRKARVRLGKVSFPRDTDNRSTLLSCS
ncbi:hypothetical protein ALC57_04658 [Trachymyrmex cornetzi]|uniref:Uncharacterized protein n=1 Tax=Trachymyrmex cornetzi TaxID=471704 RepID=A0A195ECC6_9HYME|nr:hypothetical protein ALC57_04658 [Trachymyrmex cornetzi]